MRRILATCEYPVVQALRKANSTLRELVAKVSPKSTITAIRIKKCRDSIHLELLSGDPTSPNSEAMYPKGNKMRIEYQSHRTGCCVLRETKRGKKAKKILKGEYDYKKIFCQDLRILLDYHGKTALDAFELNFETIDVAVEPNMIKSDPFLRDLITTIQNPRTLLKVKNFTMRAKDEQAVQSILELLDPASLEGIHVRSIRRSPSLSALDIPIWNNGVLRDLVQWEMAKRVQVDDFEMLEFGNLLHFETVKARGVWIDMEDMDEMMNSIFTSANPRNKHYHINGSILFNLHTHFGSPSNNRWYFRSLGTDTVVELFASPNSFQLRGMKRDDVEGKPILVWRGDNDNVPDDE